MSNEGTLGNDIISPATTEQRRRGKSMSRRSGQAGTIVKAGGWYRVRFRVDVPGKYERRQMSVKICPAFGPGLMTKSVRERRKVEIVNSFGANSVEHFNKVVSIESGQTFREQAKFWLNQCTIRKRKPVKPATICGWKSYLEKHLNPLIGDLTLSSINNSTLKDVVSKLSAAGLRPKTIRNVIQAMTAVISSAVNEDGQEVYPRKWNFEFADVPVVGEQRTPAFTGENVTKIINEAEGQERIVFMLFAATGLRAGELFGLRVKHFVRDVVMVDQSVWQGAVQNPKTPNAHRQVDLNTSVADCLRAFIGDRKEGFIFQSAKGTSIHQSNFLRRSLHPILAKLGIEKQGFHGFRRFRVTHLESSNVPAALVRYWTGHANSSDGSVVRQTVTDKYVKMEKDTKFRADIAERIGHGFELPNPEVVPTVPRFEEKEVAVSC
jgi:integrase